MNVMLAWLVSGFDCLSRVPSATIYVPTPVSSAVRYSTSDRRLGCA